MKVIAGWVKRESFPVKNKSACQEGTGIGCNCLSKSECMALQGRPSKSKVETGFLSERIFARQRVGSGSTMAAMSWFQVEISKNPDIRSRRIP